MRTSTNNNNTSPPSNGDHGIPASNEANDSLSKSSSSNAVPPNLLLKMLEACARHKRRHEFENKNQSTSAEEGRSREQKCLGELNQFASFLPRIETTVNIREESYSDEYQYYHPRGEVEESEEEGTMMRGGLHPTNRDYTKYLRSNNDQDDAENLCSLYRFIARGSFCPKAVHYLFGDQSSATGTATINALDGVEDTERKDIELARGILPRIIKLLQFLSLDPVRMVALLPLKLPHRSSKSKTMPRQIGHDALKSYYQDEDIGSTIASLLALFQSNRFLLAAVQDLINLSNDLNVIDESRVLFNPPTSSSIQQDKMENTTKDDAQSKIRVRLFTEISSSFHQNDVEKSTFVEFIHIHSQRSLLAIQCGVWVALQRLIPIISDSISLSSSVGGETCLSLLESARLALSSPALSPETEVLGWRYSPFDLSVHSLLSLRTKLGIVGLLRSMVDSNTGANRLLGSAVSPFTIELSVLAVEAAKLQMSRSRTTSSEGSTPVQNNTIQVVTNLESDLNSMYSWAVSSLLVSAVVLPDYAPSSKDMIWLHCFPYVIDCVSHMAGANGKLNNTGDESLGHVVLRLIRAILLRAGETSNSSVPKLFLHRCHVRGFFLQLFDLAKDSSDAISSSAISLLIDLFGYPYGSSETSNKLLHDSEAARGNDIEILCRNAIESVEGSDSNDNQMDIDDAVNMAKSMHIGNKRRRLQDTKKDTDTAIPHDSSIQAAFTHAVADAMRGSYAIVKKLSAQKSHGPSSIISSLNESDIGLLRCITGVLRILCSLRSKRSAKATFRYTDEAIAYLFQCIERVCDVLSNPKGENGNMQYVEAHLLPTALSLVVNVGLHACLLRCQDDTDFLNVSAREAISHCALASVSLIADDQNENNGRDGNCLECFILGTVPRLDLNGLCRPENDVDSHSAFGEESIDIALHSRCILLAALFPIALDSQNYEPTLSSFSCVLENVSKNQKPSVLTKTMLVMLPTLFLSIAKRQSGGKESSSAKALISLIDSFNFKDNVIRHTRSGKDVDECAAYLSLGRFARMHTAASMVLSEENRHASDYLWHRLNVPTYGIRSHFMGLQSLEDCLVFANKQSFHKTFGTPLFASEGKNAFEFSRNEPMQLQYAKMVYLQTILALAPASLLRSPKIHKFLEDKRHCKVFDKLVQMTDGKKSAQLPPPPIWFLIMPFICCDASTQALALRDFGRILFANEGEVFLAYFSAQDTSMTLAQLQDREAKSAGEMLFREIDYLLLRFCGMSKRLFFSAGPDVDNQHQSSAAPVSESISVLLYQTLCEASPTNSIAGCYIFQRSLLGLVRFWVASSVGSYDKRSSVTSLSSSSSLACAAFDALRAIFDRRRENAQVQANIIMAKLFSEFFLPSIENESSGATIRYQLLATFIHTFLLPTAHDLSRSMQNASNIVQIMNFLDSVYPSVIVKMIEDKDHAGIQMCTAFRMYLLTEHRNSDKEEVKARKKNMRELLVGTRSDKKRASLSRSVVPGMKISTKKLTENAKLLCSKVEVLKEVLPRLLLHSSQSSLHFFITTVCESEVNISDFLREKIGLHVLKTLVWELGTDDPDVDEEEEMYYSPLTDKRPKRNDVLLALTKGFLLKDEENSAEVKQMLMSPSEESGDLTLCTSTAGKWIAPNFMYLLVNVVVYKWGMRTDQEKFQAIKCLRSILQFLPSADSPQYIPQIMAAINNVMSIPTVTDEARMKQLSRLRLVAVLALFDFIKIVASHDSSQVGDNLTLIVITLFPLFEDNMSLNEEDILSRKKVGELLLWLANREDILPYFRVVPFLPFTEDLKDIRIVLLQKGINIDDVRLLSQHTGSHDDDEEANELHAKFHTRIHMLLHIVTSHENKNVRKEVIKHLSKLIKANRDLFQDLIVNEELASMHFLTVVHDSDNERQSTEDPKEQTDLKVTGGLITKLLARLLSRCVDETDQTIRNEMATLLGEIGAIDPNRLGREITSSQFFTNSAGNYHSDEWRLANPPWKTEVTEYQLRLVTKHFVSGLKSAPSTLDQHKLSFGIQELLKILHKEMGGVNEREMAPLLKEKLDQADVSNIVEPFWSTNYMQADTTSLKPPPFFKKSSSYFAWLSQFSKYMLTRSHSNRNSVWKDLFYACRSAIRSQAGVDVAEFIFPILVLDGVCFGDKHEEDAILSEILDALSFEDELTMKLRDREKAANLVFTLLDVLKYWSEKETELMHKPTPTKGRSKRASRPTSPPTGPSSWPKDQSIKRIERLLARIPFSSCAVAASNVGMHARALQYLELDGRSKATLDATVNTIDPLKEVSKFLKSQYLDGIDLQLTQSMLGQLNDFDTMMFVAQKSHKSDLSRINAEDAAAREMYEDWEGSFQAYERLLDSRMGDENGEGKVAAQKGLLRSLLKLGRLDSVVNQAYGMSKQSVSSGKSTEICNDLLPSAIEAAWRLGKWSLLDDLVSEQRDESPLDVGARYQIEFGRTLHRLHSGSTADVATSLTAARESVMSSLSGAARVSYARSYPCLVQLHALREVEEFSLSLGTEGKLRQSLDDVVSSSEWKDRLSTTIPDATGSNAIINTRLALSRMVDDASIEGAMWLEVGKRARKGRLYQIAQHSLAQADVSLSKCWTTEMFDNSTVSTLTRDSMSKLKLQFAKLKHAIGESTTALKIIEDEIPTKIFQMNDSELQSFFSNRSSESEEVIGRRILQATEWIVCGGLRGVTEIKNRYQTVLKLLPNWERAHFHFAKYLDSRLSELRPTQEAENGNAGTSTVALNRLRREYLIDSVNHYGVALTLGEKHVYQALPRMLAMWLEFTSQPFDVDDEGLYESQVQMNKMINNFASQIAPHLFYTALPQLISSVVHTNGETSKNVALILRNVLARYPGQAMWSCGWLRQSKNEKKKNAGDEIFASAIKKLRKMPNGKQMEEVLNSSHNIFKFFIHVAEFTPKENKTSVKMKVPFFGTQLTNFIPPIQAALTVSPGVLEGTVTDAFPTFVPRMRAFDDELKVMQSKAKPKKIRAFAVPSRMAQRSSLSSDANAIDEDIGELHFLVKKEAKGDLRKDSRVQDFNNVINRLFSGRGSSGPNRRQRLRLQLRTFSVVCMAEDCGILEWVPNTESLRSVITDTYNPQVGPTSIHRRGSRLTNFNDQDMRNTFLKCQDLYFKKGNLSLATKKFDELILQKYRPVMYWWFIQKFSSPHAWFEARTNFTLSTAVWSAVGHIIGLGDRHSENILIDTRSGECVHVDFDCIFDKGLLLPRPEVIPFRLTPNMVDAFGPSGVDGMYTGALIESMSTLRKNKDTLLSVLEPFLKDPVINSKSKSSKNSKAMNSARESIAKIEGRLDGVYNLKNPNKKKVKRQDGYSDNEDDHANATQLSVEGQVQKMIMEATSHENLLQVYIGWMPWI